MSEPSPMFAIRRILAALDASPHSLAVLETAVDLATKMQAELCGLFVEDVELLRIADSPSAREIAFPAASEAPLTRTTMECRLRAQSEQIRSALAAAAHRAQVRWSFKTVRGQVAAALRAAARENDLVAVGKLGWSLGSGLRIGSTALELATSSVPMLLISQRAVLGGMRLLVYYDGSPASKAALFVTANLAGAGAKSVTVLVKAAVYEHESAEIQNLLRGRALEVRCRRIDLDETTNLLRAVKEERAGMLVLASRQLLKDPKAFETLLREVEVPLLLLGNGMAEAQATSRASG